MKIAEGPPFEGLGKKRQLKNISIKSIRANPENPRLIFRQEELDQLMVSIDRLGVQVPITVYEDGDGYRILDGERRWRCAVKLNLKEIPALVQDKPTELQNLLLMYNIHALREQWDYFTIASKLSRVMELFRHERGIEPTEAQLSEETGLERGKIRRCRLLMDLPGRYQRILLKELSLPKAQQTLSEDFFIEMERALKTVNRRVLDIEGRYNDVRDTLITKYRNGTIDAITDFRQLSKIATAVGSVGLRPSKARAVIERVFERSNKYSIKDAYASAVETLYDIRNAVRHVLFLNEFIDDLLEGGRQLNLDPDFLADAKQLYEKLRRLLREQRS